MAYYKMNFATKTITISKEFAQKAQDPNSEESNILLHLQSICPGLKIAYLTHCGGFRNPRKGLTFDKMERYIRLHDNAPELLYNFSVVKSIAELQANKYEYVYRWFMEQFPNYGNIPEIKNGKLITNVIEYIPTLTVNEKTNSAA